MNYNTIYSSLVSAVDTNVQMGLCRVVVTADQPLFWRIHDATAHLALRKISLRKQISLNKKEVSSKNR